IEAQRAIPAARLPYDRHRREKRPARGDAAERRPQLRVADGDAHYRAHFAARADHDRGHGRRSLVHRLFDSDADYATEYVCTEIETGVAARMQMSCSIEEVLGAARLRRSAVQGGSRPLVPLPRLCPLCIPVERPWLKPGPGEAQSLPPAGCRVDRSSPAGASCISRPRLQPRASCVDADVWPSRMLRPELC